MAGENPSAREGAVHSERLPGRGRPAGGNAPGEQSQGGKQTSCESHLNAYLKPMGVSIWGHDCARRMTGGPSGGRQSGLGEPALPKRVCLVHCVPGKGLPFAEGEQSQGGGVFPPLIRMLEPQERVLVGMRVPWLGSFEAKEDFRARKQSPPERRGI